MKFYVKAFYPKHSFKNGRVIGCVHFTSDSQQEADDIRDQLRHHSIDPDGTVRGLYFTHDENGKGTTSFETHSLCE